MSDAPHKNAAVIVAWVAGQPVSYQSPTTDQWLNVPSVNALGQGGNYLDPNPLHPDYDRLLFRVGAADDSPVPEVVPAPPQPQARHLEQARARLAAAQGAPLKLSYHRAAVHCLAAALAEMETKNGG